MSTTHKRKRNGLFYSKGEETVNSLSHGIGISMAVIIGGFFLMKCYRAQDPWAILGMWLYLFGMGGSYLSSTLYHSLKHHNPWKRRLRHWDHAAIYWHIAGSFSPITLIALRDEGLWGWGLFCFVWLCAVAGTIISFRKMEEHSYVETVCYILMGLSVLVVFKQLFAVAPVSCYWIIAEGVCYIGGAALYSIRSVRYMHSDIGAMERMEIIRDLRTGAFDVLVGINLLREGLDIPEVSMVAILDADKEGFLRSETSLIQTIGRAARNADGLVVLYADTITPSMRRAMDETERRRQIQDDYNKAHGIIPQTIRKDVREIIEISKKDEESARRRGKRKLSERERDEEIRKLEKQMQEASRMLEFEYAAILRDRIIELRKENTK
mgnify:CR=1 FL=1